jgi:hypothetical protein
MKIDSRGRYRFRTREKYATCVITYLSGQEERFGIYRYVSLILRPTLVRDHVARRMKGLYVARYDAPNDTLDLCSVPGKKRRTVRARRL